MPRTNDLPPIPSHPKDEAVSETLRPLYDHLNALLVEWAAVPEVNAVELAGLFHMMASKVTFSMNMAHVKVREEQRSRYPFLQSLTDAFLNASRRQGQPPKDDDDREVGGMDYFKG